MAVLNDPLPAEHAMALHHGFEVLQPKDVPNGKVSGNSTDFTICCADMTEQVVRGVISKVIFLY